MQKQILPKAHSLIFASMEFKTTIPPFKGSCEINHQQKILMVGSCFSQEIGKKLDESGFDVLVNPFGVLFNSYSLVNCLNYVVRNKKFTSADFFEHNGLWHSYMLHSSYSSAHLDEAIENINKSIATAHRFLFNTEVLIVTLGSAWVYERKDTQQAVANCHKMPQNQFTKRKMGVNEIISDFTVLMEHLRVAFENLKVIFTISPIKHLKDGFVENNWSKSTLNIAVHELTRRFDFCDYYPAYEIMNDDLRDYRFYKNDMVHPNELATQYIFEHFGNAYFAKETQKIARDFSQLTQSAKHKVFNTASAEYNKYVDDFKARAHSLIDINRGKVEKLLSSF